MTLRAASPATVRVVLSWNGGPGSALALARLRDAGHRDVTLLHATDARTRRDPATGVPDLLVEEQAACLGLPLAVHAPGAADGEDAWADALRGLAPDAVAWGPGEKMARVPGVETWSPLEEVPRGRLVEESLGRGFRAFVVACRPPLDPSFLGRFLDADLLDRMRARGAAPDGTHHAFVVDGPGFLRRVEATAGEPRAWGEGWRLDLGLRGC